MVSYLWRLDVAFVVSQQIDEENMTASSSVNLQIDAFAPEKRICYLQNSAVGL